MSHQHVPINKAGAVVINLTPTESLDDESHLNTLGCIEVAASSYDSDSDFDSDSRSNSYNEGYEETDIESASNAVTPQMVDSGEGCFPMGEQLHTEVCLHSLEVSLLFVSVFIQPFQSSLCLRFLTYHPHFHLLCFTPYPIFLIAHGHISYYLR